MLYRHVKYLAVMLAGGACCSALAQNLLTNPGFENTTTSPWTSWAMYGYQSLSLNLTSPHSGLQAGNLQVGVPWWAGWNAGGLMQTVGLPSLTDPGYTLSLWAKDNSTAQSGVNLTLRLEFLNSANANIGQVQQAFSVPGDGAYHLITADLMGSAPAGTVSLRPDLIINGNQNALFDSVSLTVVPEPGTVGLLALGSALLLRGRPFRRNTPGA